MGSEAATDQTDQNSRNKAKGSGILLQFFTYLVGLAFCNEPFVLQEF